MPETSAESRTRAALAGPSADLDLDESLVARWLRRAVTIPVTVLMWALAVLTAPLWIPLALLVDVIAGGRHATLRCLLFLTWYLHCELAGIAAAGWLWLRAWMARERGQPPDLERLFRLQSWWAHTLLDGARAIFGFEVHVENPEAATAGPMLLMLRHASVADTLLAAELVSRPGDVRLRYVIKRELLWDPCLDLVGNRLPNFFVRRDATDSEREVRGIQALATGLGAREGVLIYPEGTRFTPAKRERVLARLRHGGRRELAARAERLRHTLPPRPGGPLGLLEVNPGLDVVFCAHTGFEGAGTFWDLWRGALRGAVVRVCFWRIPFGELPTERSARLAWLLDQWQAIDDWIEAQTAGGSPGQPG